MSMNTDAGLRCDACGTPQSADALLCVFCEGGISPPWHVDNASLADALGCPGETDPATLLRKVRCLADENEQLRAESARAQRERGEALATARRLNRRAQAAEALGMAWMRAGRRTHHDTSREMHVWKNRYHAYARRLSPIESVLHDAGLDAWATGQYSSEAERVGWLARRESGAVALWRAIHRLRDGYLHTQYRVECRGEGLAEAIRASCDAAEAKLEIAVERVRRCAWKAAAGRMRRARNAAMARVAELERHIVDRDAVARDVMRHFTDDEVSLDTPTDPGDKP